MYICRHALVSTYVCVCVYIQMTRCVSLSIRIQLTGICIHIYTHCKTLQHTTTNCNMLQHAATQCNIFNISQHPGASQTYIEWIRPLYVLAVCNTLQHIATRCNTSQHTATHRGFGDVDLDGRRPCVCCLYAAYMQHTAAYLLPICCLSAAYLLPICCLYAAYMLPICCLSAAYLLPICCLSAAYLLPICCLSAAYLLPICNTLPHTATHRNTLQHTATHLNTLQHTPTHSNTHQHTGASETYIWMDGALVYAGYLRAAPSAPPDTSSAQVSHNSFIHVTGLSLMCDWVYS